jgi:microcystin-dependent protein
MAKLLNLLRLRSFVNAGDAAAEVSTISDTAPRLRIDAGGKLTWGDGSTSGDTNLYRDGENILKTDDALKVNSFYINGVQIDVTGASSTNTLVYDGTKFAPGAGGGGGSLPSGSITQFAGSSAPTGWLSCDGANVSRTTYAALFAVVGTTYGVGDGSTTFGLPNMKGRIPVGYDSSQSEFDALGETGGAKTHTLTTAEMPSHTHTQNAHNHTQDAHGHSVNDPSHSHTLNAMGANPSDNSGTNGYVLTGASVDVQGGGRGIAGAFTGVSVNGNTATNQATTATNQNTGGGGAHNNLQPYIVLNYIIKA